MLEAPAADARDRDLALSLWTYRSMIQHRRLSAASLAREMNCSRAWVAGLLNGHASRKQTLRWLFPLDRAITSLTEAKGGILESCGCNPKVVAELGIDINKGDYWRER